MLVPIKVKGIEVDASMQPVLVLTDEAETRFLPIWVGPFEAFAIGIALKTERPERPLAYDLFLGILSSFEANIRQVVIEQLKNGIFFASLHIERGKQSFVFDARPSDAVAMAVRTGAPIYAHRRVWETTLTPEQLYGAETENVEADETPAKVSKDTPETARPEDKSESILGAKQPSSLKETKRGKIIDLTFLWQNKDLS